MNTIWYTRHLTRLLVDMHIPDWDERFLAHYSPERYAQMMALSGVEVAEIYASNCLGLCFWPTAVGYRHGNLNGRDWLGETVAACRARGLKTVIYSNGWNRAAYEHHPEWRIRYADGSDSLAHNRDRFGLCCGNSGYGAFFVAMVEELNRLYQAEGFWIDMAGWFLSVCYCPSCRERFRRESGYPELPREADWNDPAWREFQRLRRHWQSEWIQAIAAAVKSTHPERSVTIQSAGLLLGWEGAVDADFLRSSDFLAGDFYNGYLEQSLVCKLFHSLSNHRPIEFMVPRCENLACHTTGRSMDNLRLRAYAALANQAAFTLIDAIDPDGTMDEGFYRNAKEIFACYRAYAASVRPDSRPVADVAIYYSCASQLPAQRQCGAVASFQDPFLQGRTRLNWAQMMLRRHWLYTYVTAGQPLLSSQLLILDDAVDLTEGECETIRQFVAAGGKLFATFRSSLSAEGGEFRLADVFGVHCRGDGGGSLCYRGRTMCSGGYLEVAAAAATEVLACWTLPVSDAAEQNRFGSAISNPPLLPTRHPAVIRHRYGAGEVIYCSANPAVESYEATLNDWADVIAPLIGTPIVQTNAPPWVEVTVFEQPEAARHVVSLLNFPAELPALPVPDVALTLHLDGLPEQLRIYELPTNRELPVERDRNTLKLTLPRLGEFAMLAIESC